MKNCKWLVFILFIVMYAIIVFRYVQKKAVPTQIPEPEMSESTSPQAMEALDMILTMYER